MNRLDDYVVSLSMLGTARLVRRHQISGREPLSEEIKTWRCLLDELSWLCDYKTGGRSVTSIAAEATVSGSIFWFASNGTAQSRVKNQLKWILQELGSIKTTGTTGSKDVQRRIFKNSVEFSYRRIELYWSKLQALIKSSGSIVAGERKAEQGRTQRCRPLT